jgi:hypothetical protein
MVFWRSSLQGSSLVLFRARLGFLGLCLKFSTGLLGLMEAWRSRFRETRERFLEDDEEDDANMKMAIDRFQNFIDYVPPSRRAASGSRQGRTTNIERDRVIMDAQMHKDYFVEHPTHGPHIGVGIA